MAAHHHATYTPGRAALSRLAPAKACATKRAADGKARRVVVADQVVVDGLGDVDAAQRVAGGCASQADDAHGVADESLPPM
jgi:hypothetical protein